MNKIHIIIICTFLSMHLIHADVLRTAMNQESTPFSSQRSDTDTPLITTGFTDPSENRSTWNWQVAHGAPATVNPSTYNERATGFWN